jgi:hypothetical protein
MKAFNCILLPLFLSLTAHSQGVVISVSGPINTEGGGVGISSLAPASGVSWTATSPFTDISIFLEIQGPPSGIPPVTAWAYLTTSVGPGTTTADQVAAASFTLPTTSSLVPVLSGLSLGAGTYYLVVQGNPDYVVENGITNTFGGTWNATSSPTVLTDPSVSLNPRLIGPTPVGGYPPANQFLFLGGSLQYAVTGYAVPEPSALSLLGIIGLPVFLFFRWKVKRCFHQ